MAARRGELLDDPAPLQRVQALGEEIPRPPRNAMLDVAEPSPAHEQLAQDERRPAFGEDLGAERDGTELSVVAHGGKDGPLGVGRKCGF